MNSKIPNNDPSITISSSPFQAIAILNHLPDIHIIVCDPVFYLHSPDLILILLQIRKLCIVVRDSGDDLRDSQQALIPLVTSKELSLRRSGWLERIFKKKAKTSKGWKRPSQVKV
ncbi:hypothetical protein Tco_0182468 [Tanacetum coccineum]